jgi:hypothetical protein
MLGVHRNTLLRKRMTEDRIAGRTDKKQCGGPCQQVLSANEFSIDRSRRDGLNVKCRRCVSEAWKRNYSSPCVDCGNPRRSPTRGQCRRCYQMKALLKRTEFEALTLIPQFIWKSHEGTRELVKELAANKSLSPFEKLEMLVARVIDGTQRTGTEAKPCSRFINVLKSGRQKLQPNDLSSLMAQ